MAVDLNKLSEKLKGERPVSVSREGQLDEKDAKNDGSKENTDGKTTLKPKKFFARLLRKLFFSK